MDEISVKGKKYLKAKLVARELGYTNDYVGQLCRAGKVDAELVGRTWYVDPDTVKGHKTTRYRSTKSSTHKDLRYQVVLNIQSHQQIKPEHFYSHRSAIKNNSIRYHDDESDLLPQPTKGAAKTKVFELPVELADAEKLTVETPDSQHYNFEAPKKPELKFFGTLKVTDFITEVPVAGTEDKVQQVPVGGLKTKTKDKKTDYKISIVDPKTKTELPKPVSPMLEMHHQPQFHPKTVAVPVTVDEEEVRLPVIYHVITAGSFILALFFAAACIGTETTIVATKESVLTEYVFAADNLSALVYLVK